ncbi:MAG: hypothetical protein JWP35_2293 [Caulobacter sp.]|nr:hypothetical protein [Caulobacter sp.]
MSALETPPASPTVAALPRALRLARRFGPLLLLAVGLVVVLASGLLRHVSLDSLAAHHATLAAYVAQYPVRSVALFMAIDIAITALWLPGSGVMTLAAGLLFGPWLGGGAALLGATIGSTCFFLVCRGALGDVLARRFGPRVAGLEARLRANAFAYLLSLRLMPVMPLPLTNLAAALFGARLGAFLPATLLGMIPASLIFAGLGSALAALFDRGGRPDPHFFWQPQVMLPLAGLTALALGPALFALMRRRRAAAQP